MQLFKLEAENHALNLSANVGVRFLNCDDYVDDY